MWIGIWPVLVFITFIGQQVWSWEAITMAVTTAQLDGWFKRVYADELSNAVPSFAILQQDIPFTKRDKIGDSYRFPVKLTRSHGMTWAGGATAGTAFTLNNPISMVTKEANVSGSEFVLRETISYGAISRSGSGNDESFGAVLDEVPLEMAEASRFYLEMALLYGGASIGTVNADPGGGGAATRDIVISEATWAAGLWAQMVGAEIDILSAVGGTLRTNSATACLVTAVTPSTRTVSLSGDGGDLDDIAINDIIVPVGADANWFSGLDAITTNTGTLFGISATTYNLWRSNTYAVGGALTMGHILNGLSGAVVNGGLMEKVKVYLSTYSWTDLNNDAAALRRFAESTKAGLDLGTNQITYYGPSGQVELVPHPMVKAGEAFAVPTKRLKRIGSSDVTFQLPDMPQGQFFRHLADSAGIELRSYFDQALISPTPAKLTKYTGINNISL